MKALLAYLSIFTINTKRSSGTCLSLMTQRFLPQAQVMAMTLLRGLMEQVKCWVGLF